jgi:predicted RNA-binding protein associated with RNAse of E/G family
VRIHYRRPPDREHVFRQTLVHEGRVRDPTIRAARSESDSVPVLVTFMPAAGVERPTTVDGRVVLENASPVVWFTFPGARHDIGRFHTADGAFTGCYANILTPVRIGRARDGVEVWHTTDLFVDVFVDPNGTVHLLDEDELQDAAARGWIDRSTAAAALEEAIRLAREAQAGRWPPRVVSEWPLERARDAATPAA